MMSELYHGRRPPCVRRWEASAIDETSKWIVATIMHHFKLLL